jgi:hypothetical protein
VAGKWSVVATPMPAGVVAAAAQLSAVACPRPANCTAVGEYLDSANQIQGLIATESAGTWVLAKAPLPKGVSDLGGIVATPGVGPIVVGPNDPYLPPSYYAPSAPGLDAVVCPSADSCVAIGEGAAGDGSPRAIVLAESAGKWRADALLPAGVPASTPSILEGLACGAIGRCVATGAYIPSGIKTAFILTLSGGVWAPSTAPLPSGAGSSTPSNLAAVSCPTARSCTAVGSFAAQHGLLETKSGSKWAATIAPVPADDATAQAALDYVSCPRRGTCTALGLTLTGPAGAQSGNGLILTESGRRWTAVDAPVPPGSPEPAESGVLNGCCGTGPMIYRPVGLSCHPGYCVAAEGEAWQNFGTFEAPEVDLGGVILTRRSGGAWKAVQAPVPGGSSGAQLTILGLACADVSLCTVTGAYVDSWFSLQGFFLTSTAEGWSPTESAIPARAGISFGVVDELSMTCLSKGSCTAFGQDAQVGCGGCVIAAVGESLTNGSWTSHLIPLPAGAARPQGFAIGNTVYGQSCGAVRSCTGVGGYVDEKGDDQGLILSQSGNSWTAMRAPLPSNAATTGSHVAWVDAVSCRGVGECTAVGTYTDSAGDVQGLILTQSSGNWKAKEAPLPKGVASLGSGRFLAMACAVVGSCTAVGVAISSGVLDALVLTESSGTWHAVTAPLPDGAATGESALSYLDNVSCPAAGACTAVGIYRAADGGAPALVDTESAGVWRAAPVPQPADGATAGSEAAQLYGIACPSVANCVAVGAYAKSPGNFEGDLLTGSGPKWSAATAPLPAGTRGVPPGVFLHAIACSKVGSCVAGGPYFSTVGVQHGLLLTESGSTWTARQAPIPSAVNPDQTFVGIRSPSTQPISCPVPGWCVVAAHYDTSQYQYGGGLFETLTS